MGAEPLFINPNARNPERRWLEHAERNVWVAALKSAGVEHVKPNEGGRHAFITNQIAEGTDPYAVKDWAGHTSLQTTEGYKSVTAVTLARRMRRRSGPIVDQAQKQVRKAQYNQVLLVGAAGFEPATFSSQKRVSPQDCRMLASPALQTPA